MVDTKLNAEEIARVAVPVFVAWAALIAVVDLDWRFAVPALALLLVPAVGVVLTTTPAMAHRWALERGVDFAPDVVPQLRRHLLRTRLARTFGVTAGLSINLLLVARYNAVGDEFRWFREVWTREFNGLEFAGAGYLIGAVFAELTKPRNVTGPGGGVAVLAPRRLRDFADASLLRSVGPLGAMVVVAVVVWNVAPDPVPPVSNRLEEGALVVSGAVAALAFLAAITICRRAERSIDDTAVAYEELTRAATVNALLGLTIAMLGSVVTLFFSSQVVAQWLSGWILLPVSVAFGLWPLCVWYAAGTGMVFRSRRMDALRARSSRTTS